VLRHAPGLPVRSASRRSSLILLGVSTLAPRSASATAHRRDATAAAAGATSARHGAHTVAVI